MADHDSTPHADLDDFPTVRGFMPGSKVFDRYVLNALVGRGGTGLVWRAHDTKLDEAVALKFLPEAVAGDEGALAELKEETRRVCELTHPNIARIHRFESRGAVAAIAMEYVNGGTLAHLRLQQPGKVFAAEALAPLVAQICSALEHAHSRANIFHRNLKLANVLVTAERVAKVTDFGIARSLNDLDARLAGRPESTGSTLLSMSPQQLRGDDPAASDDIYALGAILYELLTGRPPFYTGDVAWQIREMAPKSVNSRLAALGLSPVPAVWDETILGCLAKEPESRPPSARVVAARLGLEMDGAAEVPVAGSAARAVADLPRREFTIEVEPADAGARVWLGPAANIEVKDGRVILTDLPEGEQELVVQAEGYQLFTTRVTVTGGEGGASARLVAVTGALAVSARPETVVTALDARGREIELGAVPADGVLKSDNRLMVGRYRLKLTHPDCVAVEVPDVELVLGRVIRVAPPQPLLPAELRVFSMPAGAEVRVNGVVVGTTPATIPKQPCGQPLRIEVFQHGYGRVEQVLTLKSREVRNVNFGILAVESGGIGLLLRNADLESAPGVVNVDGKPVEARREADGASDGTGRCVIDGLEVGSRIVEVLHPDCEPWSRSVEVRNGQNTKVEVILTPLPGTVVCATTPAGARVVINGGDLHDSTFIDGQTEAESLTPLRGALAPGAYTLRFELKGFKSATRDVTLAANRTVELSVALEEILVAKEGRDWEVPDLGLAMVFIQPGAFTMGAENGAPDEKPPTQVTLGKGFWLGKTEVTQGQWEMLMGSTVVEQRDKANKEWALRGEGRDHPIYYVSWDDAMEFCRRLNERERAAGCVPEGYGYTLPTEAQWEYACRAGTTEDYAGSLEAMGWFGGGKDDQPRPVAQKQANAWGLHDMHGNVREWCRDWYRDHLHGGSVANPAGPSSGSSRVVRGGSWISAAKDCRSGARFGIAPGVRQGSLGFRLALAVVRRQEANPAHLIGKQPEQIPQDVAQTPQHQEVASAAADAPPVSAIIRAEPLPESPPLSAGARATTSHAADLYPLSGAKPKRLNASPGALAAAAVGLLGLIGGTWWFLSSNPSTPGKTDVQAPRVTEKAVPAPAPVQVPAAVEEQHPAAPAPAAPKKFGGPQEGRAWTVPDLNIEMIYLNPGAFTMGSPDTEKGRFKNEGPQMQVMLTNGGWLGKAVVTQSQWVALMGGDPPGAKSAELPVDHVSWDDAMEFCRKLTERERAAGRLPEGYAYTLPTEAEWEYACRAGSTGPYAGDGKLDDMGWYAGNSGGAMHPVGRKQANAWGFRDMHGNAWEWCRDRFGTYPGGAVTDPTGPAYGSARVARGGSCSVPARFCRSAFRRGTEPGSRERHFGFRLALDLLH